MSESQMLSTQLACYWTNGPLCSGRKTCKMPRFIKDGRGFLVTLKKMKEMKKLLSNCLISALSQNLKKSSTFFKWVEIFFEKQLFNSSSLQGEFIFSLRELQYQTFASVVKERFADLYWEDDLLGLLHCLVNYSPTALWVGFQNAVADCGVPLQAARSVI